MALAMQFTVLKINRVLYFGQLTFYNSCKLAHRIFLSVLIWEKVFDVKHSKKMLFLLVPLFVIF